MWLNGVVGGTDIDLWSFEELKEVVAKFCQMVNEQYAASATVPVEQEPPQYAQDYESTTTTELQKGESESK